MKKEEISVLAQLLTAMSENVDIMEKALKKKDVEKLTAAKAEMISFQKQLEGLL